MRVVTTEAQAARYADTLHGLTVWTHQPTVADLDGFAAEVDAVDARDRRQSERVTSCS